jgi:hypothetical protein
MCRLGSMGALWMDRFNRVLIERRFCALADPVPEPAKGGKVGVAILGMIAMWIVLFSVLLLVGR